MNRSSEPRGRGRSGERGSIIIMTAISMLFLFLMVGLCIDVSRIYMIRAEMQNAADAAALTAARELNGGAGGIDDAVARANSIINNQGFAKAGVSVASVEFAVNLYDDPYMSAAAARATPENIRFVKVATQAHKTNILFGVNALGPDHIEARQAVAGMSVSLSGICDFFPMAVALADPSPTPGTEMTLRFTQGTGTEATLVDKDYIILEVPNITGNGTGETAELAAGLPNYCKRLGDNINMTPSSNKNNGPRNSGDGVNTRFNVYANGYGNALVPSRFPPDANVQENISYDDYINRTAGKVTTPSPNAPGQDERRVLVAPIISPGVYPAYTTNIIEWGVFFIKRKSPTPNGNCSALPECGSLPVEYVGKANIGGANGPTTVSTSLTVPVLYR